MTSTDRSNTSEAISSAANSALPDSVPKRIVIDFFTVALVLSLVFYPLNLE